MIEVNPPFRWDLSTRERLGSLIDAPTLPDSDLLKHLVDTAGLAVAPSGGHRLVFVGRSLDSVFDLLSGALQDSGELSLLPGSWPSGELSARQVALARELLALHDITPHRLARTSGAICFVDVVWQGRAFGHLFRLIEAWTEDSRVGWDQVRRGLRFVGVTERTKTSPNTWRWQQQAEWTTRLTGGAVQNVSLDGRIWSYLADQQVKLTRSFPPHRWEADEPDGPRHDERTRTALAEAVGIRDLGADLATRRRLALILLGEPCGGEPWARDLASRLTRGG